MAEQARPPYETGLRWHSDSGAAGGTCGAASMSVPQLADATTRVEQFVRGGDLGAVALLLRTHRNEILRRWLSAVGLQPFLRGMAEHTVADHVPVLFDCLVDLLERAAPRETDAEAPLDDPAVLEAAQEHARERLDQGLRPADVVTEFRLLRQEIGRALRRHAAELAGTARGDLMAAELLIHDALDGAISLALISLTAYVESAVAQLRGRLDEQDSFLASVAHDLKTPLASLKGTAQLLQRRVARDCALEVAEQIQTRLARIDATADRMSRIIDELLDLSRLQLGEPLPLDRRPVDLAALTHQRAAEHQQATDAHTIQVEAIEESESSEASLVGEWDEPRLERVLDNLLSNAIKYSPRGGTVTASVRRDDSPAGSAGTAGAAGTTGGAWAVLTVTDQGMGIPAPDLARVFERFRRAANVAGAGIRGAGLGLASARQIVEAHGGAITAESAEGKGSTFTVRLPLTAPISEAASPTR